MDTDTVYKNYVKMEEKLFRDIINFLQNRDQSLLRETLKTHPQIALYKHHRTNETILHYVAHFGTIDTARQLLHHGADINAQDSVKRTPLYRALESKAEMVNFLLNNGADVNIIPHGKTFFEQALNYSSTDTVCHILNKLFPDFKITYKFNLMDNKEKCWKICKFLLSQKIDLNSPGTNFSLILFFILRNGDEEIFKLILENNVFNLDAQCSFGHTMIHWAIQLDKDIFVKHLLDMGANINAEGSNGVTALHHAVRKKNSNLVYYLLAQGANVNKTTKDEKYSPLHYALVMDNDEIIHSLLNAGADIKAKFGPPLENSSVLNLVCGCSSLRQRLCFLSNSIDVNSLFSGRNLVFNKKKIKFLLELGADVEVSEESYNGNELTPLQRACEAGRMDIVEILVSYGADVHSKNNEGMTMIHHAALGMNLDVVELLLQKGLDVNAIDHYNRTPIYYLTKLHSNDVIPMIEFLLDNGADVNICNKEEFSSTAGEGPLHAAVKQDRLNVIECLLYFDANMEILNKRRERPLEASYSYTEFITRRSEILIAFMALKNIDVNYFDDMNEEEPSREIRGNRNMAIFFYRKCQIEIEKMKLKRICDERNITFYEFLTNDIMKVAISARYKRLIEILDLKKYEVEFPCYFFLLKKRIERVKTMLNYQDLILHLLQESTNIKLPIIVIDNILQYFCPREYRRIARILSR